MTSPTDPPQVTWKAKGEAKSAQWRSESGVPPPARIELADDRLTADAALRKVRGGTFLLYQGDYRNVVQLLSALGRRLVRSMQRQREQRPPATLADAFRAERRARLAEHDLLSRLLVPLTPEYAITLSHAPDVRTACEQVWGPSGGTPTVVALRELLGMVGAAEWRRKGISLPALKGKIHPHYGIFAPTRSEYVDLVAEAERPEGKRVFDIGTGTGVLAILMALRGAREVIATDSDPRAVACAKENVAAFELEDRVRVEERNLFPEGRADLIVCNPPWIPETPRTRVDRAIYDPDSAFLRAFIAGLPEHLADGGEAWLILSDLAELLGLRPPDFLEQELARAGLEIRWKRTIRPRHPKAQDAEDPLHRARSKEVTTLYGLGRRG